MILSIRCRAFPSKSHTLTHRMCWREGADIAVEGPEISRITACVEVRETYINLRYGLDKRDLFRPKSAFARRCSWTAPNLESAEA